MSTYQRFERTRKLVACNDGGRPEMFYAMGYAFDAKYLEGYWGGCVSGFYKVLDWPDWQTRHAAEVAAGGEQVANLKYIGTFDDMKRDAAKNSAPNSACPT